MINEKEFEGPKLPKGMERTPEEFDAQVGEEKGPVLTAADLDYCGRIQKALKAIEEFDVVIVKTEVSELEGHHPALILRLEVKPKKGE